MTRTLAVELHRGDAALELLPPRYIDTAGHTDAEFRAWLTGIAALLPRRRQPEAPGRFLEVPAAS